MCSLAMLGANYSRDKSWFLRRPLWQTSVSESIGKINLCGLAKPTASTVQSAEGGLHCMYYVNACLHTEAHCTKGHHLLPPLVWKSQLMT